jgi:hypothetical protein
VGLHDRDVVHRAERKGADESKSFRTRANHDPKSVA